MKEYPPNYVRVLCGLRGTFAVYSLAQKSETAGESEYRDNIVLTRVCPHPHTPPIRCPQYL
jgi:hypothetical protein